VWPIAWKPSLHRGPDQEEQNGLEKECSSKSRLYPMCAQRRSKEKERPSSKNACAARIEYVESAPARAMIRSAEYRPDY